MTSANATPPNAIVSTSSNLCLEVYGGVAPDVINLWDCTGPGGSHNMEWQYNAATQQILTLDNEPAVVGKCLTVRA
jgi:hypothetical protein